MRRSLAIALLSIAAACGGGHSTSNPPPDSGVVSTDHCDYQPLTPTANAGGTVTAGQLMAGAAERVLDVPVGTALGGYTARAGFLGGTTLVDTRRVDMPGVFNPSIGVEAAPRVKAIALTADTETVVIVKVDMIFVYEGMLFDVEQKLGPQFAGKVILASSHSHSAWAQFTGHGPLKLGAGEFRQLVYDRFVDTIVATANDALAARQPAKIGFSFDGNFDPTDQINHDRRPENDNLPGGNKKDDHLYFMRVDTMAGAPIAAVDVFGEHGTLQDENNELASSDAIGALERQVEEQFDTPMIAMHLQSAGGDNSPTGHGGLDCGNKPGGSNDPCFGWTSEEGHGRAAIATLMTAYTNAGSNMQSQVSLEMLSRSIDTGPAPQTFTIRDGALSYAPFDLTKTPDGKVYDTDGTTVLSPIDEFNAPVGAGLCQDTSAMFPTAAITGDDGILPYGSCLRLDVAGSILGEIFNIDFHVDGTHPVCETTRTTISALRINDYVIGTMPGELTVMLASYMRTKSPVDEAHTILVGYAQGHVGYMLRPEDWLTGGYEPSVTFWGPLGAEAIAEQTLELMPLAMTATRADGTTDGTTRVATVTTTDTLAIDNPAPMAGTVPATVPPEVWARTGHPTQAQPAAQISRISGIAQFVWAGDDPAVQTPHVTLQVKQPDGTFAAAVRRSGRVVDDVEILRAYTPVPLQRQGAPQTHYWVAEWQAVPWSGEVGLDDLAARAGVPLGTYRFHVEGSGWTLDSQPWDVVAGGVELGNVTRAGGTISATVSWHAPKGWRLLDMTAMSNDPVGVASQAMTVSLMGAGGGSALATSQVTTDASGKISVPDTAGATSLQVTDGYGNVVTSSL
jgi:neutral ceramidase|nr:neutral/alkaline non-lysosomal ceramidase N-terminal domain-containing protein [Kofleriaceae bacterium]